VLAAIAEFERDLIRERVVAGVRRAQRRGTKSGRRIGRPRKLFLDVDEVLALHVGAPGAAPCSMSAIARHFGCQVTQVRRILYPGGRDKPPAPAPVNLAGNQGLERAAAAG